MIPVTVIVLYNVTSIIQSGKAGSAVRRSWSMPIEKVDTKCATVALCSAGRAGSFFMVIDSLKCLLTFGSQGQQFFD